MLQIKKRDLSLASFNPSKIYNRIKKASKGLKVNDAEIFIKVITSVPTEGVVSTKELDKLVAEISASYTATHHDYSKFAASVAISSYHKETNPSFYETMMVLYRDGIVHDDLIRIIEEYGASNIQNIIDNEKDYTFNYFAWRTLSEMYLLKNSKGIATERPQHMYMRISLWVTTTFEEAIEYYEYLSNQLVSNATPTMINAGTKIPQLASCFEESTGVYVHGKGLVEIKDVEVGDMVITHKNNLKPVKHIFKNEVGNRKLVEFKCNKTPRIVCTSDHKFFSISREQMNWGLKEGKWNTIEYLRTGDYIKSCLNNENLVEEEILDLYEVLKEIDFKTKKFEFEVEGDMINIKRLWDQKLPNSDLIVTKRKICKPIKRFLKFDETFVKFLGLWYGDGTIVRHDKSPSGIGVVAHVKNVKIHEFLNQIGKEYFGIDWEINSGEKTYAPTGVTSEYFNYDLRSLIIGEVFEHLFGAYYHGKKVYKNMHLWNKTLIEEFIGGLISADGCVTRGQTILLTLKNENLIGGLYIILRKLGYNVGYKKLKDRNYGLIFSVGSEFIKKVINKYEDDRLNIKYIAKKNSKRLYILLNNEMYYTIIEKKYINNSEIKYVYNLEVEDDNSYCVEGIIAKNCVLKYNTSDSREGLLDTLNDISVYSADAAGIGLCMSNIRSKESKISTSGGNAGGLLKYLKIVNESLRFFNQQGRRPGSAAIYIEPWHKDIFDFLDIKKNTGSEEMRARDLFTALWIPDNFMRAVEQDDIYYLFCPNDIKKAGLKALDTVYGEEFEVEYAKAIQLGIGKKIKAQEIWKKILESQIETGVPYLASKDNANKKSNHANIGPLRQSNLCIEVMQAVDEITTAICTLASQVLKNYVKDKKFDFDLLHTTTRSVARNLNHVIDINNYSTSKGKKGGLEQRSIGIGVQGFADAIFLMDLVYTSDEAKQLNKDIWETIYHAALTESCELVKKEKYKKYDYFDGSPISKGQFQFDLWGVDEEKLSGMWDWKHLRSEIMVYGVCNSLVTASMPTASSAKITDSYEMYEAIDSNLFNRRVVGGEFIIANKYLIGDLEKLGIWSEDLKNEIIINNGSIQNINFNKFLDIEDKGYEKKVKRIEYLIEKYKTVWEISQKELISMAADRGIFIDQSQSMNIYMANPSVSKLTSSAFHAWKLGLKTLNYYIRTKAISTGAKHLAIDTSKINSPKQVIIPQLQLIETDEEKEMKELQERIKEESKYIITKPSDSVIDCFGCSA